MTSSLCFCSPSETWGSTLGPHLVESMVAVECGDRSRGITAQGSLGAQGPAAWSRASSLHGAWNLGERKGVKASSQGGNRDNKRPKGMNPGLSLDGAQVLVLCGQCHSQKMTCYDSICIRLSTLKKNYIYIFGEGNGNPLQYSCLENPMSKEASQATVHGVTRVGHDLATKDIYIYM